MSDDILPLASEFPPSNAAHWRKLTEAALKGADFDKRLVKQTYDGLRIEPLYPRATGAKPVAGRPAQPWQVMARVDHPDPAAANKQTMARVLDRVYLDGIPVELDLSPQHKDAGQTLAALVKQRGLKPAELNIRF